MNAVQRLCNLAFWRVGYDALRRRSWPHGPTPTDAEAPSSKSSTDSAETAGETTDERWALRDDASEIALGVSKVDDRA